MNSLAAERLPNRSESRKNAHEKRNYKFEARNPKLEIRNKSKMMKKSKFQTNSIRIRCFGFSKFEIYLASFVSIRGAAFDIRISDFESSVTHVIEQISY